ncbi:centrosomal protein of 95 kDa-like isoform X2 [Trichomycterus rosablanca]|uniref:centrosomal protein of 95 kDa-like isoform X2 n=1 Tax=Trichomycterus rosablanca TaxID=2290929 RepID=UPI002F35E9A3
METEERDWVDVTNDLLHKCHINLKIQRVTECDASVFVALYEAILGEKVPDYIVTPSSQEDDIHNVQSVIDSLALDYLQISLSHITGENIVTGNKDSIRNLLEIFDGLLEYLTEQLSEEEELLNGEPIGTVHQAETQELDKDEKLSQTNSTHSVNQSSKYSWNGDESESTTELIRLGDSARTFTTTKEVHPSTPPSVVPNEKAQSNPDPPAALPIQPQEPVHSAIPLQPPQQTTPRRTGTHSSPSCSPPATERTEDNSDDTNKQNGHFSECNGVQTNGIHSSSVSEKSVPSLQENQPKALRKQDEGAAEGTRRVLFRTQPDVLLLSLPRDTSEVEYTHRHNGVEEEQSDEQPHSSGSSSGRQRHHRSRRLVKQSEDPLCRRSQRNRQAEQELQEMSEKLARRLEDLDLMLKRALGETGEGSKPPEEDKHSHHSDSVMECRHAPRPTDNASVDRPSRTRSLSPSPSPVRNSRQGPLEGAPLTHSRRHTFRRRHAELQDLQSNRGKSQMVAEAYEAELKHLDEQQRVEVAIERLRAQKAEQKYREAIRKEASCVSKSSQAHRSKLKTSNRSSHPRAAAPSRPRIQTRKTAPLRVKENDMLPTLLEDFPPLRFSPHTVSHMWKQQLRQVEQLGALNSQRRHAQKLTNQLEEAHKRHNLLMEIICKEQEHSRRLRDFRERIQQQKSAQNKLHEQRQQVARARKYHNDYHVQLRARRLRARTREERMFRQVFEEGLELQKARLREQRAYSKEQRLEHDRKHKDEIETMENYYRDQFSMLAEKLAVEREEIQMRKNAQEKALQKMKRELRNKMEREIQELQEIIVHDDEEDYFRKLEVDRMRRRVQMASFQYSTNCTH